ncbi:MASE1 domain-containing protein [Lentzea sp. BCCO 10_0856]|uniref:MASE1 domain-containing protein n=1 Tax=Lentzea miocenica TaxID=3095431 RepID=A0ABU4T879_9PSEU|nr:MASE1 domain-containing protein [Lentzea sp. BCCO 10_0856]MDX8034369.1 MASE1 domain-containing protein [Lentzea sp. BCCO 10_0856]
MNAALRTALTMLAVAVAYDATAKVGLVLALVKGQVTPLWLPTGISVAALLMSGPKIWPGIALGALTANLALGAGPWAILIITIGNTAAPLAAWYLLRRLGFRPQLDRLRDAVLLVFAGALGAMLISALVGTAALKMGGDIPWHDVPAVMAVWWTGDAMGVLVFTPLLLTLPRQWNAPPRRLAEACALLIATAALASFVTMSELRLLFLVFPMLIWAALRFQHAIAAPCAVIISVAAVMSAAAGQFAATDLLTTMIVLQAFNGSVALTGLVLSAITSERNEARRAIERACEQLAETVARYQEGGVRNRLGKVMPPG